ncbi:GntR family transcriptional regulator [Ensifer sesbaniae]|jgi:DNA-binding GntR family transcriptional regulator|uniref:GntR family transcriptional regulator n=1 Tax=Ensifer sesbaniae TaxID=1214071 RepID=UPI0015689CA9|nr:GntR family transcriptional regulator [Ensifer sesbaniae]MCK3776996.1 GntR family transcriptional regulator [Ensifer sesbaniae]NRQ17094.1 HTH-type transcriptional repressor RspR [Ensifer sesbaniae]
MASTLKHRTLSGALLEEIRQAILSGRYPAGSQLRQDALAETYGVSRIPIREALFQLEAEGLVRIVPQKGAIVSELSQAEIDDVFELRALLEPRLYRRSAPLLSKADFDQLEQIQASYVRAIKGGEINRYGQLNAQLHVALYQRANMPRTQQIVASLLQTSDRYTRVQLSSIDAMNRAMDEHAELIRLSRAGDFEMAAKLLEAHIVTVRTDLLAVLKRQN